MPVVLFAPSVSGFPAARSLGVKSMVRGIFRPFLCLLLLACLVANSAYAGGRSESSSGGGVSKDGSGGVPGSPGGSSGENQDQQAEAYQEEIDRPWRVSVLPFIAGSGAPLRSTPLVESLPSVLAENLRHLGERSLTPEEAEAYSEHLRKIFPDMEMPLQLPPQRQLSVEQTELKAGNPAFLFSNELRDYLADGDSFTPATLQALAAETSADVFVSGNVQVEDDYVFIDIIVISAYQNSGEPLILDREFFSLRSIEALSEITSLIADELGRNLYNAPAGTVDLRLDNIQGRTRIYLDNEFRGTAPATIYAVSAGEHLLELYDENRRIHSELFQLSDGQFLELEIVDNQEELKKIYLGTVPRGMEVYDNSRFLGVTPFLVPVSDEQSYVQLRGEGFRDSYLLLGEDSPSSLRVRMPADNINWSIQLENSRRSFYNALGFTVISAMVSILIEGAYRNLEASDKRVSAKRKNDLGILKGATTSALWVTAISSAHTLDRLFYYLDTAETARGILEP